MTVKITLKDEVRVGLTTEQQEQNAQEWCEERKEETDKMIHDLMSYGTCAMMNGKHVDMSDVYKDEHDFFCEGCAMVASHKVITINEFTMYECEECGYKEDKALTDLLMGKVTP